MYSAVSLSIWISLTKFKALSILANALNATCWPLTLTFHGSSNWWQLLPMVQSALLVWVGDHDYGLLIYIFGNLCTPVHQSDIEAWDDDDVGSTSHATFFSPGCLITWQNHLTVWTTIDSGNTIFPIGLSKIFLITDDVIDIVI
jgi:hypothetical protein